MATSSTSVGLFGPSSAAASPSATASAGVDGGTRNTTEPIVRTQTPIFACVPASYNWTGGTPPYPYIFLIRSGDPAAQSLKTLPPAQAPGTGSWGVDIRPGTSITFVVEDSLGVKGYSTPLVVQTSDNQACLGRLAPQKKSTPVGAIVGGVIGGLVALSLLLALVFFMFILPRRRARAASDTHRMNGINAKPSEAFYEEDKAADRSPSTSLEQARVSGGDVEGGAVAGSRPGVNRTRSEVQRERERLGTFNLGDLNFTERSLAAKREERESRPGPPAYGDHDAPAGSSTAPAQASSGEAPDPPSRAPEITVQRPSESVEGR